MHLARLFIVTALIIPYVSLSFGAIEPPILRLSLETEPVTLDWNNSKSKTDRFIVSFLMRGLLKYDASAKLVCDLCTTYSLGSDNKTWTFELNPNEIWSDGVKLEASHFVDSFLRLLKQPRSDDFKVISKVHATSTHKLEITLLRPLAIFPHLLTTSQSFPIRKDLLQGNRNTGEEHASNAVLGPYILAAWEHGKRVVIEGNPQFTTSRPVYRVEFILGNHSQQVSRFKAGRLDILSNPTTEDLLKFSGEKVQVNPYWATRNLLLNSRRGPTSDPALRRAMLLAMDRDGLPAFLRSGERKVTGIVPPGLQGYRELPLVTPNPGQALIERNRVTPTEKNMELELLILDSEMEKRVAQWIVEQLGKVKIRVKPKPRSSLAYYNDMEKGNFDLALATWAFGIASPLEILHSFQTNAAKNYGKWTNVGFDAIVDQLFQGGPQGPQGSKIQTPSEFAGLIDQATQALEVQGVGVIPLGYPTQPFLLGKRVLNFATTPFGDPDLVKIQLNTNATTGNKR